MVDVGKQGQRTRRTMRSMRSRYQVIAVHGCFILTPPFIIILMV